MNSNVFYSWITQRLIPVLSQKSVLFMDNVSFHKREDILQAIEKAGHERSTLRMSGAATLLREC
ncbi:transposase [Candidatus Arsenophonus triatominarum]|uniref:transposase n=1 Tax=Candidatus Arsenophonus triatominarum TaxID=57911 RepID=UPI001396C1F8